MQILRRERHPLVAFATLAFSLRLCLVVLATALSPEAAAAAGLSSLCQPSSQEQTYSGSHDLLACQCGLLCAHGCALGPCLSGISSVTSFVEPGQVTPLAVTDQPICVADRGRTTPIRGPPTTLI
ncbi:hypothetical protein [Roseibium sp.]|uniref:hypothetical protein n=1 Tax=Roseibium sp. TaxID=1936156 RepID=UPI002636D4A9|nr:hypothetical protein [Roseibium sp.]